MMDQYPVWEEPVLCFCARDENLAPGVRCGPLVRDNYIVECCTAGYGSAVINGREFPVGPGDCYFLLPGDTVIHTADFKDPRSGVYCGIDGRQFGHYLARAGITSESPFAPPEAFEEITAQVEQMVQMREETDAGAELRRTACIYGILGALLRGSASANKNVWVQRALGVMEDQYYQPLSVEQLASEVGLERSYFSTLFRQQTGRAPHAYLNSIRVRKACALMEKSGCSVAEAAASVGLDPQNFARLFKRETGKTPKEYIREKA